MIEDQKVAPLTSLRTDDIVMMAERRRITNIDDEVERCWQEAENLGWHKEWDEMQASGASTEAINSWVGNKLLLIVSEIVEAQDELRSGRGLTERHYTVPAGDDGSKPLKPEGFLVELADAWIRINDLVGVVTDGEPSFGEIVLEKLAFNATRGQRHGGKAF